MEQMLKVLIVEDEVLVRLGLKSVIRWGDMGMEIIGEAANGVQALEIYEKSRPDIILTDIKMPVMDGLEMLARIREKDNVTRVVVLTCYEEFKYLQSAMRMGISDYILKLQMKPAEIETVMAKIRAEILQDTKKEKRNVNDELSKENIIKEYIFYHQIPEELFRNRLEKLNLKLSEKNLILCRMAVKDYESVQNKLSDKQGMQIRFLVMNIVREIVDGFGGGELLYEKEDHYLLLLNLEENSEYEQEHLHDVLYKITGTLESFMGIKTLWTCSRVCQKWEELPVLYEECCHAEENRINAAQKLLSCEIYEAVRYIEEHLEEKLTLNQVAEHVSLSPNYMSSLFKKEMEISFTGYISRKRVDKAVELLKNTDMKAHEVAEITGFEDVSYFSRTFKKITGKRPSVFRKRVRE